MLIQKPLRPVPEFLSVFGFFCRFPWVPGWVSCPPGPILESAFLWRCLCPQKPPGKIRTRDRSRILHRNRRDSVVSGTDWALRGPGIDPVRASGRSGLIFSFVDQFYGCFGRCPRTGHKPDADLLDDPNEIDEIKIIFEVGNELNK